MQMCDCFFVFFADYNAAITSISTRPPFGNAATATAERAGKGAVNRVEYTSFSTAKLAISVKKTVVLITWLASVFAAFKMAATFFTACSAWLRKSTSAVRLEMVGGRGR